MTPPYQQGEPNTYK